MKEWGLIQMIGSQPSKGGSSPHSFFMNILTTMNKEKKKKQKEKKINNIHFPG
jgi:hypothetical protein